MIFMFNFFKKSKSKGNEVKAPIKGNLIPLSEVSDDVFSQKMLGDGFAVKPTGQEVVAPVSGTITTLFPTKHAIVIKTAEGLEVLIHLGIDTVELKGEPFKLFAEQGDSVRLATSWRKWTSPTWLTTAWTTRSWWFTPTWTCLKKSRMSTRAL